LTYIATNYKTAPALQALDDYSQIQQKYNDSKFIETLIYNFNHNKLDKYLGDMIIKFYKKEDPSQQSLWNSDTSRLTYIIKELLNNNNSDWLVDKKGIKTCNYIIDPLLQYIDVIIKKYLNKKSKKIVRLPLDEIDKISGNMY